MITVSALMCLFLFASCGKTTCLAASTYAVVEDVQKDQLELDLGVWRDGVFTYNEGEVVIIPSEIVSLLKQDGTAIKYEDLKVGDIIEIDMQTDVNTVQSEVRITVIQHNN